MYKIDKSRQAFYESHLLGIGLPGQAPQDFNSSRFFCERVDHIEEAGGAFFAGGTRAYAKYIMLCLRQRAPHYV